MAWRVARSLDQLLGQLNRLAPKRSKISDGSIGDAAHASRSSDHNPWFKVNGQGVVTARDFTHDPRGGLDCHKLADALVRSGDPRIKYIIWNRRIWQRNTGWKSYSGINPHTSHLHLSVVASALTDSAAPWNLPGLSGPAPQENDVQLPTLAIGDGIPDKKDTGPNDPGRRHWFVLSAQALINLRGLSKTVVVDGQFGAETEAAIKELQKRSGLPQTGRIDAVTWYWLLGNDAPDYA